jgi:hypothetical protein
MAWRVKRARTAAVARGSLAPIALDLQKTSAPRALTPGNSLSRELIREAPTPVRYHGTEGEHASRLRAGKDRHQPAGLSRQSGKVSKTVERESLLVCFEMVGPRGPLGALYGPILREYGAVEAAYQFDTNDASQPGENFPHPG